MKTAPSLLQNANQGKGKAIKYTLIPIPLVRKLLKLEGAVNSVLNQIDETVVKKCVKLFDDLNSIDQKLNDIATDLKQYQSSLDLKQVQQFFDIQQDFSLFQTDIQKNLSRHLILVRSGKETADKLLETLDFADRHPMSYKNVEAMSFENLTDKMSFLSYLAKMEVKILNRETNYQQFLFENFNVEIYILFYSFDKISPIDRAVNLFRKLIENRDSLSKGSVIAALDYDSLKHLNNARSNLTSSTNKIRVYKNGVVLTDSYVGGSPLTNETDPQIWSFAFMQSQVERLIKQQS